MRSLVVFGLLAGCYSPAADPACLTACDPALAGEANACPGSLVCMSDGKCHDSDGSCGTETDGGVDGPPGTDCYGDGPLKFCIPGAFPSLAASNDIIDTTQCPGLVVPQDTGPAVCVIGGAAVTLANIDVIGTRPLVVISASTLVLNGYINAASEHGGMLVGPGSNDIACEDVVLIIAGAGGNGGSFGGSGGKGGKMSVTPAGLVPTALRGGCPGGNGIGGGMAMGGRGGGAIYFIARTSITVNAIVNASGAGGSSATGTGGGGGGSGGMIGFDAPMITAPGMVFANGGGGAGGASLPGVGAGGDPISYDLVATGGTGVSGGNGGTGSLVYAGGDGGSTGTYGGGGGGGAGVIWVYPPALGSAFSRISPAPPE